MTFMDDWRSGKATREDLLDHIDTWHSHKFDVMDLHEYLGMTWKEYQHFMETNELPLRKGHD